MAWRSSRTHFASKDTTTHVVYSSDAGKSWTRDLDIAIDGDVREAHLKSIAGILHLFYFEGGTNPRAFQPRQVMHRYRIGPGMWSDPEKIAGKKEVIWDLKEHAGKIYKISYKGPHYRFIPGDIFVKMQTSDDGMRWSNIDDAKNDIVYTGGVSEVAIEFDEKGNLWGVGRNEDGDETGFGTQIFYAKAGAIGKWWSLKRSRPERYDSPKLFRHGKNIYLLSRRPIGNKFDRKWDFLPFNTRRWLYLGLYSLQTMRTALFRFNRDKLNFDWILDLPSAGDNAFPSIVQDSKNEFTVVNYSSPLQHTSWTWLQGQKSKEGTLIYSIKLKWIEEASMPE